MKFFTADLLNRYGADEPVVYNPAMEEWDQACTRYGAYLASIKGPMTPGLRRIVESYSLHDATVQGMGKQGRSFVIMLQLDGPPHSLVTFTFDLLNEPIIDTAALPAELRSTGDVIDWQYDELELIPGDGPSWSWSILFSNGWEVKLHFRDVQVQEHEAMIPIPRNGEVAVAPTLATAHA